MLALSPRAVERLESYVPPRPLPKIFRLLKAGKLNEDVFKGSTINTPSMLCVEDALDSLRWAESIGGLSGTVERSRRNLAVLSRWVERTPWVDFLAQDPARRSCPGSTGATLRSRRSSALARSSWQAEAQ